MAGVVPEPELVAAAKAGDRAAAGEFFSRHLEYLRAMSRRVAPTPDRAEDLLAGAIARLLELWARGHGPDENVLTYLVSSMRNRIIDESRSPRAREAFVEELPEARLAVTPDFRGVDLLREARFVRAAFGRLPPDSQHGIREVIVNGRPPREVAPELGRSAGALSTLVTRAKAALRRELLVVILREGRAECAENAEGLPAQVLESPDAHPSSAPGLGHVLGCAECRANWGRYATLTSALGILPLLSVGLAVGSPAPVATAAAAAGPVPDAGGGDPSTPDTRAAPAPSVAVAAGIPGAGVVRGVVGTSAGAGTAAGIAAASGMGAIVARAGAVARSAVIGSAGVVVAVGALIAGAGLLTAALLDSTGVVDLPGSSVVPIAAVDAPAAHLRTMVTPYPDGTVELEVAFEVDANDWSLVSFAIALPDTVRITSASGDWNCSSSAGGGICTRDSSVPVSSRFTLTAEDGMPEDGKYLVQLEALAEGVTTTGYSSGPLPASESAPNPAP